MTTLSTDEMAAMVNRHLAEIARGTCSLTETSIQGEGDRAVRSVLHQLLALHQNLREVARQVHETEMELIHAHRLESVGQLAAGIAHEINTPMQYIGDNVHFLKRAFVHLLEIIDSGSLEDAKDNENAASRLTFIRERVPRAIDSAMQGVSSVNRIVRSMRDYSHPGGDEKVPWNVNQAIENALTMSRNAWKYAAELELDLDPSLPHVPCIPGEFNQVILNCIINAADAIAQRKSRSREISGLIAVKTQQEGDWVEIHISDNGPGIPKHIQSRVFDPFFTTKQVGKGTGQGLSIARSIINDRHGGSISCKSEEGHGTTFLIRLPLGDTAMQASVAE